jgi:hypothetical protein
MMTGSAQVAAQPVTSQDSPDPWKGPKLRPLLVMAWAVWGEVLVKTIIAPETTVQKSAMTRPDLLGRVILS